VEIMTAQGPALVELEVPEKPRFLLALTHGAGGSADAPDLAAAGEAGHGLGGAVARITQPYRIRGGRAPGSVVRQDEAWTEIIAVLREKLGDVPLIQGGRSNGARVACRTAAAVGARGVIALAFPLHPPGHPERSRVEELRGARRAGVAVLVVNGDRDPFGIPGAEDADRVVVLGGETHALSRNPVAVQAAVAQWLTEVLG
jgi:predicted alpha/beta-hydrolase family hydrolase